MLAYPVQARRVESWGYPVFVQPKLNGRRARTVEGNILLTSEENINPSVPHINKELERLNAVVELDGELYKHGFKKNEIDSRTARSVNLHPDYKSIEYHVFDIKDLSLIQSDRFEALFEIKELAHLLALEHIKFVPIYNCHDWKSIIFHQNMFVEQGYEGIIIRNPIGKYIERKTYEMMKHKPTKKDSYEIVGYEQLESMVCPDCFQTPRLCIHGVVKSDLIAAPKEMLGAFICKDVRGTRFNVGSGKILTKAGRIKYWEERDTLVGKTLVVKYETLSDAKGVPVSGVVMDIV